MQAPDLKCLGGAWRPDFIYAVNCGSALIWISGAVLSENIITPETGMVVSSAHSEQTVISPGFLRRVFSSYSMPHEVQVFMGLPLREDLVVRFHQSRTNNNN